MRVSKPIRPNPLASPSLMAALPWLQPCPRTPPDPRSAYPRSLADAAALAEMLVIDADRP